MYLCFQCSLSNSTSVLHFVLVFFCRFIQSHLFTWLRRRLIINCSYTQKLYFPYLTLQMASMGVTNFRLNFEHMYAYYFIVFKLSVKGIWKTLLYKHFSSASVSSLVITLLMSAFRDSLTKSVFRSVQNKIQPGVFSASSTKWSSNSPVNSFFIIYLLKKEWRSLKYSVTMIALTRKKQKETVK